MNIFEALCQRKSVRAFLDKPVRREKIINILQAARHAPSGTNAQPWQVAVVTGNKKAELTEAMEEAFRKDGIGTMDYSYYPLEWIEPYKKRRVSCGAQLYSALNIERRDKESEDSSNGLPITGLSMRLLFSSSFLIRSWKKDLF